MLDPKLQDGKMIPKRNCRLRMLQFFGFSDKHLSLAANVRTLSTGYISSQFHLVFDNKFKTVVRTGEDQEVTDAICNELFEKNWDWYVEDKYNSNRELVYKVPPLNKVWLKEPEQREGKDKHS